MIAIIKNKTTARITIVYNIRNGKTGADWDSAPEQTGTLLMRQS